MQNCVLDAVDILINRHHLVGDAARGRRILVPRIGEAREVPRRIHEGVHGVGFAARMRVAALRTCDGLPCRMAVERLAGAVVGVVVWLFLWLVFLWFWF